MAEDLLHQLPPATNPTAVLRALLPRAKQLLDDESPVALFFDMDALRAKLLEIKSAFPANTMHSLAMKANPLAACLLLAKDLGFGVEVASPCELEHAIRLEFAADTIIMDSPCKTRRDLRRALAAGARLNADNIDELARIDEILAAEFSGGGTAGVGSCQSVIGVRVNPQLGGGKIAATGTIAATSKFGVALGDSRAEVLDAYSKYAWLTCVHCHVGSQGCPMSLLVDGAREVVSLAAQINEHVGREQIRVVDIGGGMPADYGSDAPDDAAPERITPARYAAALRAALPELGRFDLLTEFGRHVSAKCGLVISRVEYVKSAGGRRIAAVHCGADLFLRTAYQPQSWPHRVSAWDAEGGFLDPMEGDTELWDVVGPLCFRGDIVASGVRLPTRLCGGMHVCVHDAGAYTLAMFSKYNSRQAPPVYGVTAAGTLLSRLSDGETVDDALRMWQVAKDAKVEVAGSA